MRQKCHIPLSTINTKHTSEIPLQYLPVNRSLRCLSSHIIVVGVGDLAFYEVLSRQILITSTDHFIGFLTVIRRAFF